MRLKSLRILGLCWLAAGSPLIAGGQEDDARSAQMIEQSGQYYGITGTNDDCDTSAPGDAIVVCGKRKAPPRIDPPERTVQRDNKMTALGSSPVPHLGGGVSMSICFLQKCPKKLYFIDLKAIPEPPPGSDADRIAKGEMRDR